MIHSLNAAQSGLSTSQIAIENAMNNITNENSQGYIKRVANLNELDNSNSTYANGVGISSIDRSVNEYMAYKIQGEASVQSYYSKSSSIDGSLEVSFMETDSSGLSKSLNNYFQSVENLRSNPSSEVYKSELISNADNLIFDMQSIYKDVENIQSSLKDEMYTQSEEVNKITSEIANLNEEIAKSPNSLDLYDKRELLINELSTYGDIEVHDESDYYQIKLAGNTVVFNNTSNDLSVVEDYTSQKNVYDTTSLNDSNITSGETISLTLNNSQTISIVADTTGASDNDVKQQLVDAINLDPSMNETLKASLDDQGNLVVESKTQGEESFFDFEIQMNASNASINKNNDLSQMASDDIHIEILDKRAEFKAGSLKALDENTTTTNVNNVLYQTQKSLNDMAYSIIDTTKSYIKENDEYIYGDDASKTYTGSESINSTNLFSGASVMTMNFNDASVNNLSQEDLDYLATLQFKDDISMNSSNTNSKYSYSEFLMEIKVDVASTKESMDFKVETQNSIVISLQSSYDQISKVDSDEELINLMQFQSAYEANAKVITAIDEMLQTVLNM